MTIRLLCAYDKYPANAIVTLDSGTEAGLVNAKMASTNTAGGVPYVPPAAPNQLSRAQILKDGSGNVLGLADANGNRVDVGGAVATITGTPGINNTLTATLPAGVLGTLQWTRTTKAVPPVKSNIAGAVANAVNSLNYVQQQADGGCLIGCDASNQVAPSSLIDCPPSQVVTNNAIVASTQYPTASVQIPNGIGCQVPRFASSEGAISNLVFTDVRGYINSTFGISFAADSSTVTLTKYVEYPQGTFTPVLYGGSAAYGISLALPIRTSDPVNITIPAGAAWWEHTIMMDGTPKDMTILELPAGSTALGTLHAKYTTVGNAPAHQSAGTTSINYFGASLITGTIAAANVKSHAFLGDSVAWGEGDITGVGVKGSSGYLGRLFDKNGKAYVKIAKPGMSAFDMVAVFAAASPYFDPFITLVNATATNVANEFGVNDLRLSRTQTQLLADYQTIYSKFSGKTIAQTTLTNRSSSTDAYATTVNQTARSDGNWGAQNAVNDAIRAGLANVTTVIEASDAASTARNSRIWPAPPVPTVDGTHPNSYMANVMATAITFVPA